MYTVTRRRHQSKTRYLIGVCVSLPNKWMDEYYPDFNRVQISFYEWELTAKSGERNLNMILEFKEQRDNIKFVDITLTMSTKNLL